MGHFPLHLAFKKEDSSDEFSLDVASVLLDSYPEAVQIQDEDGYLPLHIACENKPSLNIIIFLLDVYPKAAQIKGTFGCLPLHIACRNGASADVVEILLRAYPKAVQMQNIHGWLPIHGTCETNIVRTLLEAYPDGAMVPDGDGRLPLHSACIGGASLETYPASIVAEDRPRKSPEFYLKHGAEDNYGIEYVFLFHNAIRFGLSVHLLKLLLQAFPESSLKRDNNGMLPLHHACASTAPHFIAYVMALLGSNNDHCFKTQDYQGRTPSQLLKHTASRHDKNEMLPLHRLAACSKHLSEKSLLLLAKAYPESLTSPDKYGILPFHYACLNPESSVELLMLYIHMCPEIILSSEKYQTVTDMET